MTIIPNIELPPIEFTSCVAHIGEIVSKTSIQLVVRKCLYVNELANVHQSKLVIFNSTGYCTLADWTKLVGLNLGELK